jgi:hypothetical protein
MGLKIQIPPTCVLCKVLEPDQFPYPHKDGLVLTRIKWAGMDRQGRPAMEWEGASGTGPSQFEFPAVSFVPVEAWCPVCCVVYHMGAPHPNDAKAVEDATKPKLVKP